MNRRHYFPTGRAAAMLAWSLSLAACLTMPQATRAQATDAPVIAVAANMQFAIEAIGARFRTATGQRITLAFGASGNFARQIEQGAPFEMFVSADEDSVFRVADKGLTLDRGALYAVGRLVLFVPSGSPLKVDPRLDDVRAALTDGRLKRFAIANPEIAPYGKAAVQVLRKYGLWDSINPKLVFGENVGQTGQFAVSGSVQAALLPYSLALVPGLAARGAHVLIPADEHEPLRQRMVLTNKASPTAKAFFAFMQADEARKLLAEFGYGLPTAAY